MSLDFPRSGVQGVTALDVRLRLRANGWPSIPITPHDGKHKSDGKRPAIRDWQRHAIFVDELVPLPIVREIESVARRYPDAQGTGIPCGSIVGIDIDVSDPALVDEIEGMAFSIFGPTPFIREGRAPRRLLVYRATEAMPKQSHKALNETDNGIDIQAVGSQFVAFGVHPKTYRPYRWIGAESPLTASPDQAPEITSEQLAAFLSLVNAVLPLSASGSRRERAGGGQSAAIVRDEEGFVIDGREQHLANVVWRAACGFAERGDPLTFEALTDAAWAQFVATARLVVAGREWTRRDAEDKSRSTLDRVRRGLVELPRKVEAVALVRGGERMPLADAEVAVRAGIDDFFTRYAFEHKNARGLFAMGSGGLIEPKPSAWVCRIEAGIGKTEAAIEAATRAMRAGLSVVVAVPRIDLADELAARFAKLGVDARVWRGREKADPEAHGVPMCLNLTAAHDAIRSGAFSVKDAVCETKDRKARRTVRCEHFDTCGHIRQQFATPRVWIVTHAMLLQQRPSAIAAPDAVVIDEGFVMRAFPDKPSVLTFDRIEAAGLPAFSETASALAASRRKLLKALRSASDGPLTRAVLASEGLTSEDAEATRIAEGFRSIDPGITPGTDPQERARLADEAGTVNREVVALAGLWREIAVFLSSADEASGRLLLSRDAENGARQIERRSLKTVDADWKAPTLILDATAPPAAIVESVLGLSVEGEMSISARWTEHRCVRQILGAPVSATKLGISGRGVGNAKVWGDLRRLIVLRAALVYPRTVAIIAQKKAVERLTEMGLPPNVVTGSFGALAGLDSMKSAAGMIVIGRLLPTVLDMEAAAGVLSGSPVAADAPTNCASRWYPKVQAFIRVETGTIVPTDWVKHPDPITEALRWQACEAELIQAIGRLRPLRRGTEEPFFLDILADAPLPVPVDEAVTWESARVGTWAEMAAAGVVLTGARDIEVAFPDLAPSRKIARTLSGGATLAQTSIEKSYLDVWANVRRVEYKRKAPVRVATAFVMPNGPQTEQSLKRWLSDRLGPIEWSRIEGVADEGTAGVEDHDGHCDTQDQATVGLLADCSTASDGMLIDTEQFVASTPQ